MRKKLVVVLAMLCVLAFCMAPAAASSFDLKVKKSNGMTITPIVGDVMWPKSVNSGTVTQGQIVEYTYPMPSGSTKLMLKLEWGSTSNNLVLSVLLPDGTTYGGFDDYYDSPTPNGKTSVQFQDNPLQLGTWKFHVSGKTVTGSQSFTLTSVSS